MGALAERSDLIRSTERVSAATLAEELASPNPPLILDIRAEREWTTKHLAGGVNIPLPHLSERIAEIPPGRTIAVHCAGGYRSSMAVSILNRHGITNLLELAGGIAAWEAARFPVVTQ
jgi:rhodanese-related sulfurtransferase